MTIFRLLAALLLLTLTVAPPRALAAVSEAFSSEAVTARLVTAEDGVAPDATTLSAGLHLDLRGAWKSYWRSPGEVGLPPTIDWTGSENVAGATMLWPAPTRFEAFGIENLGYADEVLMPLEIVLERPGERATLRGTVSLLVCETICVPERFELALDLGLGTGIDRDAAMLIAEGAARVPQPGEAAGISLEGAAIADDALTLRLASTRTLAAPDIFPEIAGATFGPPDIRVADGGTTLWARLPLTAKPKGGPTALTVRDGAFAAELPLVLGDAAPAPPDGTAVPVSERRSLTLMIGLALLGGLILNVMPCVLPVLSIKLASAVKLGGGDLGRVRAGFLAAAAGVMAFVLALAVGTLALRSLGVAVGWGMQFQSPAFLAALVVILTVFAGNMAGAFEIALPGRLNAGLARAGSGGAGAGGGARAGLLPDFLTGAFAALLATPCSAPFLGTAVAFALSGSAADVLVIFTALGVGLALPYLLVALRPGMVRALPKPGPWMRWVRLALALALLATALWLALVLADTVGAVAAAPLGLAALAVAALVLAERLPRRVPATLVALLLVLGIAVPALAPATPATVAAARESSPFDWTAFDRTAIAPMVARGTVVFVDVTAAWCLTCKANKAATLDREPVASLLGGEGIVAMQADWTRPDEAIRLYLQANGRYGIPFNIVYGPGAPAGVPLPEILTDSAVLEAVEKARG